MMPSQQIDQMTTDAEIALRKVRDTLDALDDLRVRWQVADACERGLARLRESIAAFERDQKAPTMDPSADTLKMLNELSESWTVSLTRDGGEWRLEIAREGRFHAYTSARPERVIRAAWAGEPSGRV